MELAVSGGYAVGRNVLVAANTNSSALATLASLTDNTATSEDTITLGSPLSIASAAMYPGARTALSSGRAKRTGRVPGAGQVAAASPGDPDRGLPQRVGNCPIIADGCAAMVHRRAKRRVSFDGRLVRRRAACPDSRNVTGRHLTRRSRRCREAGFVILEEAGAGGFASGTRHALAAIARDSPAALEQIIALGVATSRLPQYRRSTDDFLYCCQAS